MATSTFTQPLSSENSQFIVQCCFTSTETVQTIRDRIATSTFTQLLSSELQPNSKDRKPFTTCFFNHCHNLLMPQASNGSKFVTKQAAQITSGSYIRLPAQIITQIIQIKTTFFIQAGHSLMFTCVLQCYVASTVVTKWMEGICSMRLTAVISVDRCTEIISAHSVQCHNLLRQSLEEGCQKARLEV